MKKIDLKKVSHNKKIGDSCGHINPNVTQDSLFYYEDEPIGFYLKKLTEKGIKYANLANYELRSKNVPKSEMKRSSGLNNKENEVLQYSTIIGSCPPKPHMMRPYPAISSVHSVKSAKNFILAMLSLVKESENIIHDIMPKQFNVQLNLFKNVPEKWKFGKLFTSSISNYNISANYHIDNGNIKNTVNVIICKKLNTNGGDLNVPDYDATIGQEDNSILVYPAWRNMHGVTPIIPTYEGGYRNSLVFYPLKAFLNEGLKDE